MSSGPGASFKKSRRLTIAHQDTARHEGRQAGPRFRETLSCDAWAPPKARARLTLITPPTGKEPAGPRQEHGTEPIRPR
jgi:hypothetical protein